MNIAIIGTGIAGLAAASALRNRHDITVYEARERLGGHSHTVDVETRDGLVPVDTGFIVYNERTYPNLTRLFDWLGTATEPSDMSFAFSLAGGVEYAGSLPGLLSSPVQLASHRYRRMIGDILRFRREGHRMLAQAGDKSVAQVLDEHSFSDGFAKDYLLPMAAAIWSARIKQIREFPAASLLQFFSNHGLIRVTDRPQWRTVAGGSRSYLARLVAGWGDRILLGTPVEQVTRHQDRVEVLSQDGRLRSYDQVVIAAHSDQALTMLGADATDDERAVLGSIRYESNRVLLHTDQSLMPRRQRVWSSWNYLTREEGRESGLASVTYWMNRLQNLDTSENVFVSLNPLKEPRLGSVHGVFQYAHPQFDHEARKAQLQLPLIQGRHRTWFAGAWAGYGFHEDGLTSGLVVAASLGSPPPWTNSPTLDPTLEEAAA